MISSKVTILCLYEILKKYSDENHILSAEDIRKKLKNIYDVDMERRAIYRNIDALREMNIDIEGYSDNREGYYLVDRMFEPSDIRMLCDAVASSDIISNDMSKEIMEKLLETQSVFEGNMLKRLIYVKDTHKKINKNLFYNLDLLNVAINQGRKVSLRTIQLNYDMENVVSPEQIVLSPYATFWAKGEYYIIVKKEGDTELSHLKVDRLTDINLLEQPIEMHFGGVNPEEYARRYIINKGEHLLNYELEIDPELWDEAVGLFGDSISVKGHSNSSIKIKVNTVNSTIFEFVAKYMGKCKVISPKEFREEIQKYVFDAYNRYW